MAAKMLSSFLVLAVAVVALVSAGDDCSGPANTLPIYDKDLTLVKTVTNGYLYQAAAQQGNVLRVAHVYGTPYDMGKAQADLFGSEIVDSVKGLEQYMYDTMAQYIDKLPLDIQKILEEKGVAAALKFTAELTKDYTPQYYFDEAKGVADGLAGALSYDEFYNIQMFPEVIKASCSMFGAWGKAIANVSGTLYQLRALDFGIDSPLVNHSVLMVYHPAAGYGNTFVSLTWVGFIGSVTSYSGYVGMSEKVWLHYNLTASRAGIPFHFLIRDVAQFDITVDDAINRMVNSQRTCSVFLGVGDNYTMQFRAIEYGHEEVRVFDDRNFPAYAGHPLLEGTVYIDKHTQPSDDPCLGSLVQRYYGSLSPENTIRYIVAPFGTGDLHAAVYDYATGIMYASIAGLQITSDLKPVAGTVAPAYSRPWFKIDTRALQNLPAPSA